MANIPNKPSYSHGSTGTKPGTSLDYANGDALDADNLDYYVNEPFETIKDIIDILNDLDGDDDGRVDAADDATTVKGNDIDSNGDGTVDAAEDTTTVKGNDIDSDGDGIVDESDDTNLYKGNDIDSDGDGIVNEADDSDKVDGHNVFVQGSAPSSPNTNDLWVDTS